jgi:FkbM family methyltransferase
LPNSQTKPLIKTPIYYKPTIIFKRILNFINKSIAKKNIKINPQLVIFSFDHIGLSINSDGRYEDDQLRLLEHFINEKIPDSHKYAAVDIGANIGNHSVFFSKFFNKVHSFEPNPITYDVLSLNSKYSNPKKNIVTYNFGLSDKNDSLLCSFASTNIGGAKIKTPDYDTSSHDKNIYIEVKIADEINSLQEESISLIKVDIEGHEINALKGSEKIIKSNKPIILFEQGIEQINNYSSETIEYLSQLNYSFYIIQKRFYFGNNLVARLLGMILDSFFGNQLSFIKTNHFEKRQYDIILAIHNDEPHSS